MKNKTLQKVLAVLLALGLLMSFVPTAVTAERTVAQPNGPTTSKFVDRSISTISPSEEVNLAPIHLAAGSMAYAVEIRSTDTFYKIPDLDAPGTWQAIASAATYYAGDSWRAISPRFTRSAN